MNRRRFVGRLAALSALGIAGVQSPLPASASVRRFRIRTITAGIRIDRTPDARRILATVEFLRRARRRFEEQGWEVQTVRIATQPFAEAYPDWKSGQARAAILMLESLARDHDIGCSMGPIISGDSYDPAFAPWAADLLQRTSKLNFTVAVATVKQGMHRDAVRMAAETMLAVARSTSGGEGNFRFAAGACIRPGTPFFPVATFSDAHAFSIGLESALLLQDAFASGIRGNAAKQALAAGLELALRPVEECAQACGQQEARNYLGIDVSPAPAPDASIGRAIELLTGQPFGSPSTLAACADITDALKSLSILKCGYSGLMLPVLEDPVLAARAAEGHYRVSDLLLFSSVCGAGLDVVPVSGDASAELLAGTIGDLAALASKYRKPLSARLFPIVGKKAGDRVRFDNPHLVDAMVMPLGRG